MSQQRRQVWEQVKRVVVKVGSGVLTGSEGLERGRVDNLAAGVAHLMRSGRQVVLVSSGAIASGRAQIGMLEEPRSIPEKQACAALGQAGLMQAWERAMEEHGYLVAQLLLTAPGLRIRARYLNARNTIFTLMGWRVVPVVNENDTVVVDEIKLGDNDNLAAMLTNLTGAQLLISLTNVNGLYEADPRLDPGAQVIPLVKRATPEMLEAASGQPGQFGRGGMLSKIKAAEKVARCGAHTIVANGLAPDVLQRLAEGEELGTLFLPHHKPLSTRKHWIAFTATQAKKGRVVVDDGAVRALTQKGKSLLAVGVRQVMGGFAAGDAVQLVDQEGHVLGVGLTNYSQEDLERIRGLHSEEIEATLGHKEFDEVIHRDHMVIFGSDDEENVACLLNQ